jgi:hypothetical protein
MTSPRPAVNLPQRAPYLNGHSAILPHGSGVALTSICQFEIGKTRMYVDVKARTVSALETAGIVFIEDRGVTLKRA